MSLATDSPIHSSNSDDFAAFLDTLLSFDSSKLPLKEEAEDEIDDHESRRKKRFELENLETLEQLEASTSQRSW